MRTCEHNNCNRVVFRTDKLTRKGYCQYHWKTDSTDIDKRSIIARAVAKIKASSNGGEVPLKEVSELEKWFANIAKEIAKKPYCANCGSYIPLQHYRHATAHLLPKKTFKSVATHPMNYIIAGSTCGCHHETHRWDLLQRMNCFPLILQRLIMVEPDVAPEERKNLPQFLLDHIEKSFI